MNIKKIIGWIKVSEEKITIYNKLVRDKIPEHIESQGHKVRTRKATRQEYSKRINYPAASRRGMTEGMAYMSNRNCWGISPIVFP